jgi:hypothetical protein
MKAFLDHPPRDTEVSITEEARVFRAEIARWAATYVERRDVVDPEDACRKASANLRVWSHEYFRAMKRTETRGARPC